MLIATISASVAADVLLNSTVRITTGHRGAGSGVVTGQDGIIVTNAHVATAPEVEIETRDGSRRHGEVVARDVSADLAAVRFDGAGVPKLAIRESASVRAGDLVISAGYPRGPGSAVVVGVVNSTGRESLVVADIRLAPGYSGGAMVDSHGLLIGVNTMISGGLGLAVASDVVSRFLEAGLQPSLGMEVLAVASSGSSSGSGLLVTRVVVGGPAHAAGVMLGDIIVAVEGNDGDDFRSLVDALRRDTDSSAINLKLNRGGVESSAQIWRTTWTDQTNRAA